MRFVIREPSLQDLQRVLTTAAKGTPTTSTFAPRLDFAETETGYILIADLPGIKKQDVTLGIKDNLLTLSGSKAEDKYENFHFQERTSGDFSRTVVLPEDVNVEGEIDATMDDGVLYVKFERKKQEEFVKKIEIR
ncbi:Heat shock protein HSP 90-beta [Rhizoclosmatium sp. JEL0117]|nr:Heat shock protein HSP 90-beta [Rhizoclosmatium sp. JEL0117]